MAPTRAGWREVKMALHLKRPHGEPADLEAWATRELPRPSVSVAYPAVADCETFSSRWAPRTEALGIDALGPLTVLGDEAEWIWRAAAIPFPAARQVLDIFHGTQPIAQAASVLHGEATVTARERTEAGRRALLADGWPRLLDHVGTTLTGGVTPAAQAAIDDLIG